LRRDLVSQTFAEFVEEMQSVTLLSITASAARSRTVVGPSQI
jgi:hypothetical protein